MCSTRKDRQVFPGCLSSQYFSGFQLLFLGPIKPQGTGQRGGLLQDIAIKDQLRDGLALLVCQKYLIHLIYQ